MGPLVAAFLRGCRAKARHALGQGVGALPVVDRQLQLVGDRVNGGVAERGHGHRSPLSVRGGAGTRAGIWLQGRRLD